MILITGPTGATGSVGGEAVRLLLDRGAEVAAATRDAGARAAVTRATTRDPQSDLPAGALLVHPEEVKAPGGVKGVLLDPRAAPAGEEHR